MSHAFEFFRFEVEYVKLVKGRSDYQYNLPLVIDHRSLQETTSNFFLAPHLFLTLHLFDKYDFNINMENMQCCDVVNTFFLCVQMIGLSNF